MRLPERRRSLALLMGAAALLGHGGRTPDARAQEAPAGPTGEELFGSYTLEARGQGMRVRYEIEGMLPGGLAGARPRDAGGAGPLHLRARSATASPRSPIPAASS